VLAAVAPHVSAGDGAEAPACVMCVGHNRGWEEAASEFAAQAVELKTANAAVLEAPHASDWPSALAAGGAWSLRGVLTPD
jgi:phosphohistidine phosphatase SixA